MNPQQEIHTLLETFQNGYTRRDVTQLDDFMNLFTPDVEVIGTNGIKPGVEEWYSNRDSTREMIKGDWQSWGDFQLDLESVSINVNGDMGWIAAPAVVSQTIGSDNYASFLDFVKEFIETSNMPAEQKLNYILRGGTNTIYEIGRGEKFIWPLRFTAVVVREAAYWKFAQVHFSFPTIYFPDVRDVEIV